ncbi:tRNA (adenine(58)-N(1))-methyltransferase catalytic subunit TRMT61A-like [Schistocerca americana]|uniref:tRNA (adenine(58)-N(1))-methyltransferase catalytic subunit TRMT61A-like n=1 Tax=Schistocerca americana TaxID=7009 RepID=UPI001F4FCC05|nr:tRNA (adenine(58)-N(1))-methyltransferase catalytic subunit TRMT61A-like [Schistocerca americana]XP_049951208.1 tRNA (adenine(58)-N(1))-methyltransferase catalytic subunit TRMT61A-like [Schistocerca serialis cubense]
MSFARFKEVIEEDDTVILYVNVNSMHALKVTPQIKNKNGALVSNVFQTVYGALKVDSLIGKKFGSKVKLTKGWVYVLHPTPELWTLTLLHRTQIIYTPDISMIIFQLELKPGSIVIEAGTGSGSLSHALIRTIKPSGHLFTYDFHAARVDVVREEFKEHGLSEYVSVEHRDVCEDGFGAAVTNRADAVFLDLPKPWDAVPYAVAAFKQIGGRFVSFSPCIEQVQNTCKALSENGFFEIVTMECLLKELNVQVRAMPILNIGTKEATSQKTYNTASPGLSVCGHSGYITAATLPPRQD